MTKNNISLTLSNRLLEPLGTWLDMQLLSGRESRERTRFIDECLSKRITEIKKFKNDLQEEFGSRGKDNKLKTEDIRGRSMIDFGKNKEKANDAYAEYMKDTITIDVLEGNKAKVYTVKDIILNTDQKFQGESAVIYSEWCEIFEKLPNRKEV